MNQPTCECDTTAHFDKDGVCMLPLKGHIRGENIFQAFMDFVNKTKLLLVKLISINGAPAMVGSRNKFIAFCKQNDSFSTFIHYHCITNQQALCKKVLSIKKR